MGNGARNARNRLVKLGLIAAVTLTLTWWTLLAAGAWQAIAWAAA